MTFTGIDLFQLIAICNHREYGAERIRVLPLPFRPTQTPTIALDFSCISIPNIAQTRIMITWRISKRPYLFLF